MQQKRATILIADDEESVRRVVIKMLGSKYVALEAKNGEEALQLARANRPNVILMDMFMPKMDGCTACFELKKDEITRVILVVAMTGRGGPLEEKLVLAMGAKGYLSKPFDQKELLNKITPLLKNNILKL